MNKSTLKKNFTVPYAQVLINVLNCPTLSFKAKGLYAFMVGKPPNWKFSYSRISKQTSDGESSVRSALLELRKCGLLIYQKLGNGTSEYIITNEMNAETESKPKVENQREENQRDNSNKENSKKDSSKKDSSNPLSNFKKTIISFIDMKQYMKSKHDLKMVFEHNNKWYQINPQGIPVDNHDYQLLDKLSSDIFYRDMLKNKEAVFNQINSFEKE